MGHLLTIVDSAGLGDVAFRFTIDFAVEDVREAAKLAAATEIFVREREAKLYGLGHEEALEELAEFERRYGAA
jgi:hypothetical protein